MFPRLKDILSFRKKNMAADASRIEQLDSKPPVNAEQCPADEIVTSEQYWSDHNVTLHKTFGNAEKSLEYFHWRNDQYIGYIDLMPVTGQDGKTVLDFGCGPGNDVVGFSVFSKPSRIIAMDISQPSLEETKARLRLHGGTAKFKKLRETDTRLPLRNESVDYIHCSGVLMCVSDPLTTLREFHRILKPSGHIRLMVYNYDSIWLHLYVAYMLKLTNLAYKDLTLMEAFRRSTDGEDCPINGVWTISDFLELGRAAGFQCRHLGNAISLQEMIILPQRYETMQNLDLPAEHRRFLMSLTFNARGIPFTHGQVAGIDGCYEFTK